LRIEIIREIDKLRTMTVTALREKYLEVFGEETRSGNKDFLWKRIAWRIQAIEEGDLSERARRRAEELSSDADLRVRAPNGALAAPAALNTSITATHAFQATVDRRLPVSGTMLTRQYKGATIRVMVLEKGFEYNGKRYRTLSSISQEITGSRWNGYHFFGLQKEGAAA